MNQGYSPPSTIHHAMHAIAATTDINALLREVFEAYRLTVSLERDIHEISSHYDNLRTLNAEIHEEIMLALDSAYSERANQIKMIERIVILWTEKAQYDLAHSATMKMMQLLEKSPLDQAMAARQSISESAIRRKN